MLATLFPWIKSLHVIAVISWMAGLLYLPRLFVYHSAVEPGSAQSQTFKLMERRLLRAIMNPAMVATFVFGLILIGTPGIVDFSQGWIWVKLAAVAVMTYMHHLFGRWHKDFEADRNPRAQKTYRYANEVPTLLLIVIVIMVIVKPF